MRILFISPSFNPLDGTGWGATQRTNLLFEACAKLGHVDVVSFVDGIESERDDCTILYSNSLIRHAEKEERLMKFLRMLAPFNPYALFPKNKRCANVVKSFIEKGNYDIIICRYISEAMLCGLYDYTGRVVIDVDDNPYDTERTAALESRTWRNRLYHWLRLPMMKSAIKKIQHNCFFSFYANPEQAIYNNSVYLPNIPFYEYDLGLSNFNLMNNKILFVGNMSYGPNLLGVDYFIKNIFPLVQEQIVDVEFHLVGGCNQQEYINRWSKVYGVHYKGFVDDLKQEYEGSKVVVVPIYSGAGTNIKVLEAMQMKRPCVTTKYGMRGFYDYFKNNKDIVLVDDDTSFALNIIKLLREERQNHTIATNGYLTMKKYFSRQSFNSIVEKILKSVSYS